MPDFITTLHPENDENTNLYPNIKKENIPYEAVDIPRLGNDVINLLNGLNQPKYVSTLPTSNQGLVVYSDGYLYSWNGTQYVSTGIVYQATQIQDGSVTPDKTTFFNVFKKLNTFKRVEGYNVSNGLRWSSSGSWNVNTNCARLSKYTNGSPATVGVGITYSKNTLIVTKAPFNIEIYKKVGSTYTLVASDKSAYVVNDTTEELFISLVNTTSIASMTSEELYSYIAVVSLDDSNVNTIKIEDMDNELLNILLDGRIINMFNVSNYRSGGFYLNSSGVWQVNSSFNSTGFVRCINSDIHTSNTVNHRCYWDKYFNYIGSSWSSNAYYVTDTINASTDISTVKVCFNGTPNSNLGYLEVEDQRGTSKLNGKTVCCIGDSMVSDTYGLWKSTVANNLGISYIATTISVIGGHICAIASEVDSEHIPNADIYLVWGGTNDWYYNRAMGNITDIPSYEVNVIASIKYIIKQLSTLYPTSKTIVITPHYRKDVTLSSEFTNKDVYDEYYNNAASHYTLRELSSKIEDLCKIEGIACLNMMSVAGINSYNYSSYLQDGVHDNTLGGNNEAKLIEQFMLEYC